MTVPPIVMPNPQFLDQNGKPYAGATIATYVKGTSTPKATWLDPGQAAVNENPLTLDGAGRCLWYADGDYRAVLHDIDGNLIFDVSASTIISAAMYPVVSAPSLLDARNAMGVTAAIDAEATARQAAIDAEAGIRSYNDNLITANYTAADAGISDVIVANVTGLINTDTYLQAQINSITGGSVANYVQGGLASLTASGSASVTFPTAFATACTAVTCVMADSNLFAAGGYGGITFVVSAISAAAFTVTGYLVGSSSPPGGLGASVPPLGTPPTFYWTALGH